MSDYSVTLSTTEPNNYVGLIKLRQGDVASQSIQATITANGQLFNFDRLAVFFNAVLPNGNVVRDKVTNVDYVNSKLNYIVADSFLQEVAQVTAWFSFENDEKIIDSTKNFQYSVIAGWKECIPQGNYIYELSEIQREIEEIIGNKDFTSLISKIDYLSIDIDFLGQLKADKLYVDTMLSSIAQGGPRELFYSVNALKSKYPNGTEGTYLVFDTSLTDGAHSFMWDAASKVWKDLGLYQSDGSNAELVAIRTDSDGVVYDLAKSALDMAFAKDRAILKKTKDDAARINGNLNPRWQLGLVDEITGEESLSPKSIKAHSDRIPLGVNQSININLANGVNGLVLYYKDSTFVRNSGYFTNEYNVLGAEDFTNIVVMIGYTENITITDPRTYTQLIGKCTIIKNDDFSITNKISQNLINRGLSGLNYQFGRSINLPSSIGDICDIKGQAISTVNSVINPCVEGDVFLINASGGSNARAWAFLDAENKVIALSKSGLTINNKHLVAPAKATKLIINTLDKSLISYKLDLNLYKEPIVLNQDSLPVGNIDIGKYSIGDKVDPTMKYNTNFSGGIFPVSKNTTIYLNGSGGSNPRFMAWLDKDYKLLFLSDVWYASRHEHGLYKVPENASYLVFNSNLATSYKPTIVLYNAQDKIIDEEDSGQTINQRTLPSTMIMSDYNNGKKFAEELNNPLFNFTMDGDIMSHCSSFRIVNEVVYASYYINKIRHFEDPTQQTAVLRIKNVDGSGKIKNVTICDIGDTAIGGTVGAIYDTVVLTELGDIRVVFTAKINGQYYLLYKIYDPNTDTLTEAKKCEFTVGNNTQEFSISGMKTALKDNNVYFPYFDSDISFMQKLSPRTENGETWYYLGLGVLQFCFIAKTKDLVNYHYVSQPTFKNNNMYEPTVYCKGDEVFWLCRQAILANYPYAHLSKYNLVTGKWDTPVLLPDCQSRSDMFEYKNVLYAIHAPFDRNHLAVTQINTENLSMSFPVQTAYINNLFYPFVQSVDDKLFMTVTQGRNLIQFYQFTIHEFSVYL
ncbi:phage baseplate upper protein [Lactococcus lactis]|uniref:phage baseplate upper protein n=1 Tax=Lactococcus lactis TaxID=1358 RepID=UPI0021A7D797|nr:phage baseplate upper protein [Lactococcus lactis]MCT3099314.1 DUF2479 domain-containing protein [Lactococcus lactis]